MSVVCIGDTNHELNGAIRERLDPVLETFPRNFFIVHLCLTQDDGSIDVQVKCRQKTFSVLKSIVEENLSNVHYLQVTCAGAMHDADTVFRFRSEYGISARVVDIDVLYSFENMKSTVCDQPVHIQRDSAELHSYSSIQQAADFVVQAMTDSTMYFEKVNSIQSVVSPRRLTEFVANMSVSCDQPRVHMIFA